MAKKNGGGARPKVATLPGNSPSAKLQQFLTEPGQSAKPPSGGKSTGNLPQNKPAGGETRASLPSERRTGARRRLSASTR